MPRLSRLALICLVLALFLPALACSRPSASTDVVRPWESLPEDVVGVAHFDVRAMLDSELLQALNEGDWFPGQTNEKLQELQQATGFDVLRDLDSITIGGGYQGGGQSPFYMIVRGVFDVEKIDGFARGKEGVEIGTQEGLTTYSSLLDSPATGEPPVAALVNDSTMIVASTTDFPKLVRAIQGSASNAASSALADLMAGSGGQVFFAMQLPEAARQAMASAGDAEGGNMFAALQEPLAHMETVLLTVDLASDFQLAVTARVDTPESGQLLYEQVQGFVGMAKMFTASKPETADLLDGVTVQHDGRHVQLSVVLTREQLEAAMSQATAAAGSVAIGG
jgi:hypothetical protein